MERLTQLFRNLSKNTLLDITTVAWPMAFNAVLIQSTTLVDLLLIAGLGDVAVAGYGIAGAIVAFVIGVQFAIANGTQLVLSRAVGAGDINKIGLEVASGWVANLGFSVVALIFLLFTVDPIIHLISHDLAVAEQAISYVRASLCLLLFSSFSQVIVVYFNANKKSRIPLYGFMIEIPLNVLCSVVLVNGLWAHRQWDWRGPHGEVSPRCLCVLVICFIVSTKRN